MERIVRKAKIKTSPDGGGWVGSKKRGREKSRSVTLAGKKSPIGARVYQLTARVEG